MSIETEIIIGDKTLKVETLRVSRSPRKKEISGRFSVFAGKSDKFFVFYIPSLNVSGYGLNSNEATEDLKYNMEVFCDDLIAMPVKKMKVFLQELGWNADKMKSKQYSNTFIDKDGVLQNFDNPSEVTQSSLEIAA